jgi:hypothetical protein
VPVRRRRSYGVDIHPSAGKVVGLALVVFLAYAAFAAVAGFLRDNRVDTWQGPDATVQSGQHLAGCPAVDARSDVYFPSWIRFEGKVFSWASASYPMGDLNIPKSYVATDYAHDDLRIYRVESTPEGRDGKAIIVRQGEAPAGALYRLEPGCV